MVDEGLVSEIKGMMDAGADSAGPEAVLKVMEFFKQISKENEDLVKSTAKFLGLEPYSAVMKRLKWIGLLGDEKLPENSNTPLDYLNVLTLNKMSLDKSERDMIVMHHEFIAEYSSKKEYITSTLVDYGTPYGDSAISRTVALPAAIAVKMIIMEQIDLSGVHIPVIQDFYNPILNELREMDIKFVEKSEIL